MVSNYTYSRLEYEMKICDSPMLWLFYTLHQLESHADFRSGFGCGGKANPNLKDI